MNELKVALIGNPNSGKTSIFNNLTGLSSKTGNYPGVTIEKKERKINYKNRTIKIVDLPGIYSLTTFSPEELITRNYIVNDKPDVVVIVLDSVNIERNLYLATQIMEMKRKVVLVFNMSDLAKAKGIVFDLPKLETFFDAPIVKTIGNKGTGKNEILDKIISSKKNTDLKISYGQLIDDEIINIEQVLKNHPNAAKYNLRWLAIKLLEKDNELTELFSDDKITNQVEKSIKKISERYRDEPQFIIADKRYGFISGACQETIKNTVETRHDFSDTIDNFATNRTLGLPIFLGLMYLVFYLTFSLGQYPMEMLENFFNFLGVAISNIWPEGSYSALKSLITDGIIGGVGGVIVFLPNIILLFMSIAILEDTGYMARAAFVMDSLMHRIGLHGKSFIPLVIGFGCSVPAIMATRIIDTRKDRLTTMLIVPLISCGARLPIYTLIIPAFFPFKLQAPMLWLIYIIGILLAILSAKLLRTTILKGETQHFVMELPPYRIPTFKSILIQIWEKSWLYMRKAGTIILFISIIIWALTHYPEKKTYDNNYDALMENEKVLFENKMKKLYSEFSTINPESKKTVETRLKIEKIEQEFKNFVNSKNIDKNSVQYSTHLLKKNLKLEILRKKDPLLFDYSVRFLNDIIKPYENAGNRLNEKMQQERLAYTFAGKIGKHMEPVLKPMGFDWKIGTALIGAIAAKEVFVAGLGIVYAIKDEANDSFHLRQRIKEDYNPLIAFCLLLFTLIATPCAATVAITKKESGSLKWALLQFFGLTIMAYIITTIVYQIGSIFV